MPSRQQLHNPRLLLNINFLREHDIELNKQISSFSLASQHGHQLLRNFLDLAGALKG